MHDKLSKLFSKKTFIILGFIAFSLFWFGDFLYAYFYMIGFHIAFYFYEKNNRKIENISKNNSYIASTSLTIFISYIIFSVHYLSVQNPNKVFDKNNLVIDTYYIPEYKSVRTRSDGQILVENDSGTEVVHCSVISYGRCPYYKKYGKNIEIGFVKIRKNFYRAISDRDKPNIAYYLKFGDEVIPSEYFIEKYDKEMKDIYLFLISLNLYMIFLYYIKISYGINLRKSFSYVFSDKKETINCIWKMVVIAIFPILFVFL